MNKTGRVDEDQVGGDLLDEKQIDEGCKEISNNYLNIRELVADQINESVEKEMEK